MKKAAPIVYEIMHGDRKVAQIDQYGHAKIYCPQTLFGVHKNQREAAEEAVCEIGLNQLRPVKKEVFHALPHYYKMFLLRLEHLKKIEKN